jgi:hypothetical protein
VNPFNNYLDKFGNHFLVAAMIPSLGLVVACILVFDPILYISASFQITDGVYYLFGISLLVLIPTVIIGYTLTALNTFILKIFEGYVLLYRLPRLTASHQRKAERLIEAYEEIFSEIVDLTQKKRKNQKEKARLAELKEIYYDKVSEYDQKYPPPSAGFMPTQFGNILKASEAYPNTRYGIDAVEFWPRLLHVIPPSYKQNIDEARNELSFLVNMSALSLVFYAFCIIAILSSPPSFPNPDWDLFLINSFRYILFGLLALASNRFFNKAALFSVGGYGAMIRSAYDLFRLDLLEHLRLKTPKDSEEEYYIWKNLGEFVNLGSESVDFKPFVYKKKANQR